VWLAGALSAAGERWVIVVCHQPLQNSAGGERLLALLDAAPQVIAVLSGHTQSQSDPRPTLRGGRLLADRRRFTDRFVRNRPARCG
jgi:hypothetical protein